MIIERQVKPKSKKSPRYQRVWLLISLFAEIDDNYFVLNVLLHALVIAWHTEPTAAHIQEIAI
ncbi:hypothetical protein VAEKB19_3920024 [Vibrio aestuarianus]|nr:hypothetical protein VAEKB19_3920024 [Vibrio aestuarianus]